jgi:hypothetical protein
MLYQGRQRVRSYARRALDRLDPPEPASEAPRAPLRVVPEATPNPLAVRYGVSRPVGLVDGHTALGRSLLAIDGVVSVYGTGDFVTITREEGAHAPTVEAEVVATLQRAL